MNNHRDYIDIHIHLGGPGKGEGNDPNNCYWSRKFTLSPAFWTMRLLTGTFPGKLTQESIWRNTSGIINRAKFLKKAVLLAMDEVYLKGNPNPARDLTHLYVSNDYVFSKVAGERIVFGASVHPYSPDALDRLERYIRAGAVLCKWLPSSMGINPSDTHCDSFYEKLAYHNLPLLCHAGAEHAIPSAHTSFRKYNNPKYLQRALRIGVTVIVAHCALPYLGPLDPNYFSELLTLLATEKQTPGRIYADISAFCTPTRAGYIKDVLRYIPSSRLIYGSDYPIPTFSLSRIAMNPLDKNYFLTQKMGFPNEVFAANFEHLMERIRI